MATTNVEEFKKNVPSYPRDSDERDNDWYLKWLHFALYQYNAYYCPVGPGGMLSASGILIDELRRYAQGRQNHAKYKAILDPLEDKQTKGGSFIGASWDNHMVMPKILDIVRERIMMIPMELSTEAMDDDSMFHRKKKVGRMKAILSPLGEGMREQEDLPAGVNTPQDVEDYLSMGMVILEEESDVKDLLDDMDRNSSEYIESKIVDDLTEVGIGAKEVICDAEGRPAYKYVDPARLVFPAFEMPDGEDLWYVGVIEDIPISRLRNISDLTEEELFAAAKKSDQSLRYNYTNQNYDKTSARYYESHSVRVLRLYWTADEAEDWMIGAYKSNSTPIFKAKPKNYKEGGYAETKISSSKTTYVYQASLVVATNRVFGCKKMEGQVRRNGTVKLPIIIHCLNKPALVERCRSLIDDIQLEIVSLRDTIAKLPPFPRLIVDESLLNMATDVRTGEKEMTRNIREFFKNGILRARSKNEYGDVKSASNRPAITPINMEVADELIMRMNRITALKEEIKDISGINSAVDGSIKNQDILVGTMERMEASATMVLSPYVRARKSIKRRAAEFALAKIKMASRNKVYDIKSDVGRDVADIEFEINVVVNATKAEIDMLIQALLDNRKQSLLSEGDFMIVFNMLKQGDVRKAQFYMVKAVERAKREAQQAQQQNIMLQGKMNNDNMMANMQMQQQISAMKLQNDKILKILDGEIGLRKEAFVANSEMEQLVYKTQNEPKEQ